MLDGFLAGRLANHDETGWLVFLGLPRGAVTILGVEESSVRVSRGWLSLAPPRIR